MQNVVSILGGASSPRDMALIRRTVAADTNDDEFNVFMNYCNTLQLNPLRRQIYAIVYNKNDPKKRKMSIIVAIDGFRAVAARSGNYRPDDEEPRYEYDPSIKGPGNPLGIVKASVKVWQFSHGQWFPVSASAYWDEYAPRKIQDGAWPDGNPKFRPATPDDPIDRQVLDTGGKWGTMPRLMLAKCAEALALRKAWPDDFSNVYAPEEMDAGLLDLTPAEIATAGETSERMDRIGGGNRIMIDWLNGQPIEPVPVGKLADRIFQFVESNKEEPSQIGMFEARNRHSLKEFWAHAPGDALEVKKAMEAATKQDHA